MIADFNYTNVAHPEMPPCPTRSSSASTPQTLRWNSSAKFERGQAPPRTRATIGRPWRRNSSDRTSRTWRSHLCWTTTAIGTAGTGSTPIRPTTPVQPGGLAFRQANLGGREDFFTTVLREIGQAIGLDANQAHEDFGFGAEPGLEPDPTNPRFELFGPGSTTNHTSSTGTLHRERRGRPYTGPFPQECHSLRLRPQPSRTT